MHKIVHMTSAHSRYDTRIFYKMCSSLASKSYDTSLIVADTLKNEKKNNVSIISTGHKENSRLKRMLYDTQRVYKKALDLDGHLYHIHDPELIPAGLKLKKNGKKVIFDAHEDLPQQILSKPYLSPLFRKAVSKFFEYFEHINLKKFDAIIAATPFISNKIKQTNPNTENINNYPLLSEFKDLKNIDWSHKKQEIAYVGGISKIRGISEIIKSLNFSKDIRLNLAGSFSEQKLKEELKKELGWQKVNELGWLDRQNVIATLKKSQLGLVTLYPTINYIDSLPVKMFEYMSAGLPVIASHFPLWKSIITHTECGLCVDPLDPQAIWSAILEITSNPEKAKKMGENGRNAVEKKYNWQIEEQKLLKLYEKVLN
ncbi:MAG: glycosyl transferase [Zetaproteobacteria bacterium]|nr:glycosyl transferase [Pseudobdellovibrionaceae bacterium]